MATFHKMDNRHRAFLICFFVLISTVFNCCSNRSENNQPILLFNGTGTSPNDVAAIETILDNNQLAYSTANSAQLNEMDGARLRNYQLLIVPGGNFIEIGKGLTSNTRTKIRNAVHNGLNYHGICAGAFFAGNSPYNGLDLTSGVRFGFYGAEVQGMRKGTVSITGADGAALDQYWEDGPQLTGWGSVIAKYPDGTPAIAEGRFGNGKVILSGIHAEAPEYWRKGITFHTSASADNAYAATLIRAGLNQMTLKHYPD